MRTALFSKVGTPIHNVHVHQFKPRALQVRRTIYGNGKSCIW